MFGEAPPPAASSREDRVALAAMASTTSAQAKSLSQAGKPSSQASKPLSQSKKQPKTRVPSA